MKKKIIGEGMDSNSNLIIEFDIIFPTNLSEQRKTYLKKLLPINTIEINKVNAIESIVVDYNESTNFNSDSDGEDDPMQVKKMIKTAARNPNKIITSNRKQREEPLVIIVLYKLHLIFTFLFTWKWISFGNFSTFNKSNLNI